MKIIFLLIALFLSLGASAQEVEMVVSNSKELKVDGKDFILLNLSPLHSSDLKMNQSCLKAGEDFSSLTNDLVATTNVAAGSLVFAANVAANGLAAYSLFKSDYDKTKHFMAGYIISSTTTGAFQLLLPKTMKHRKLVSAALGFGASVLIGTAKEVYDAQHPLKHSADKYDAYAAIAGGAVGTVAISFTDVKKVFSRKK
jgi:hypothetical protein